MGRLTLLRGKVAVVYGAGGAIGGAVARTFAREGATLFLAGRRVESVRAVADAVVGSGGEADAAQVDALDEDAVEQHVAGVIHKGGRIDVVLNAVGFSVVQGVPLTAVRREDFVHPIVTWTTTQFLTARAVARHMTTKRSGVILTLSASPARAALASTTGFGVACAAIEGLSRTLAAELGPTAFVSSASGRIASATRSDRIRTFRRRAHENSEASSRSSRSSSDCRRRPTSPIRPRSWLPTMPPRSRERWPI